jgi:hypothetical protein
LANGSGVFRGDRNTRLGRLRERVRLENTIVGIELATGGLTGWSLPQGRGPARTDQGALCCHEPNRRSARPRSTA